MCMSKNNFIKRSNGTASKPALKMKAESYMTSSDSTLSTWWPLILTRRKKVGTK